AFNIDDSPAAQDLPSRGNRSFLDPLHQFRSDDSRGSLFRHAQLPFMSPIVSRRLLRSGVVISSFFSSFVSSSIAVISPLVNRNNFNAAANFGTLRRIHSSVMLACSISSSLLCLRTACNCGSLQASRPPALQSVKQPR